MKENVAPLARNIKKIRYLAGKRMGLHLKGGRKKAMTTAEFAHYINVGASAISNWENGNRKPEPHVIDAICYVADVSRDVLLEGEIVQLGSQAFLHPWPPRPCPCSQYRQKEKAA